jgi:photosystem II stability/assembly factor-like uncharacterized protein
MLVTASVAMSLLAGCVGPGGGEIDVSHVHGLAYDPEAEAVFVATHDGLARGTQDGADWSWVYVGPDRFDYMGFTQDAERAGVFYSSGHPSNPATFGGSHLGLRRSTDGGETWEQRSLKGQVDFHALTSIPGDEGWLAGAWQGAIKVSRDGGGTWTDHPAPRAQVYALAGAPGRLLAGTSEGLLATADLGTFGNWTRVDTDGLPKTVVTVAASADGAALFATAATGQLLSTYASADGGATWSPIDADGLRAPNGPVLFAVDAADSAHVFASTADGHVLESRDQGATWATLRR